MSTSELSEISKSISDSSESEDINIKIENIDEGNILEEEEKIENVEVVIHNDCLYNTKNITIIICSTVACLLLVICYICYVIYTI